MLRVRLPLTLCPQPLAAAELLVEELVLTLALPPALLVSPLGCWFRCCYRCGYCVLELAPLLLPPCWVLFPCPRLEGAELGPKKQN